MNQIAVTNGQEAFELAQREAKALSVSTLMPKEHQGNIANCMIIMEMSRRTGIPPLAVAQNLHIINGKPGWSAKFLIGNVANSGKFSPLRFEVFGNDPFDKKYRVRAYAEDLKSGEKLTGAWITWQMVDGEGWSGKGGSKWKTMPEQMFFYRASSFWINVYAPDLAMGMRTKDEQEDIHRVTVHQMAEGGNLLEALAETPDEPVVDGEVIDEPVESGGQEDRGGDDPF